MSDVIVVIGAGSIGQVIAPGDFPVDGAVNASHLYGDLAPT